MCRFTDRVEVKPFGGEPESFDHVVFACHSDQALRILGADATAAEREILPEFPYGRNVALLHTDVALLPRARRAWASWNYRLKGDASAAASVTYNMNLLQGIRSRNTFCLTLNDESCVDPARLEAVRVSPSRVHHPPRHSAGPSCRIAERQPHLVLRRYWKNGFHEDGVNSALAAVHAIRTSHSQGDVLPKLPDNRIPIKSSLLAGVAE